MNPESAAPERHGQASPKHTSHLGRAVRAVFDRQLYPDDASRQVLFGWLKANGLTPRFDKAAHPVPSLADEPDSDHATLELPPDATFEQGLAGALAIIDDTYRNAPELRAQMGKRFREELVGDAIYYLEASRYFASQAVKQQNEIVSSNLKDYARQFRVISQTLDPELQDSGDAIDIDSVERWLLGDAAYDKRVWQDGKISDQQRTHNIAQIFGDRHERFQQLLATKTAESIRRGLRVADPIMLAVHDRGTDMVANQIEAPLPEKDELLIEYLKLDNMAVRLQEVRQTNDLEGVSKLELEFAQTILEAIRSYPYAHNHGYPSVILSKLRINCLGATAITTRLLVELGIESYAISMPSHSMLAIHTADGRFYLTDATPNDAKTNIVEIPDELLDEYSPPWPSSSQCSANVVLAGAYHPSLRHYRILNALQASISVYTDSRTNLGATYISMGRLDEAVDCLKEAIRINPELQEALSGIKLVQQKK